jgi:hypothetical protein
VSFQFCWSNSAKKAQDTCEWAGIVREAEVKLKKDHITKGGKCKRKST